jgi:DNA-binding HxlR family transcriptional regulator
MRCKRCEPLSEDVRRAADILERRYSVSIIFASHAGASRFNEFRQVLAPIPPGTLAVCLTELEEAGLLERRVFDSRPPRVEYVLTDRGQRLESVLAALRSWAATG